MNNRTKLLIVSMVFISCFTGCGDTKILERVTVEEQRALDSVTIAEFITAKGFDHSALDTTASGAVYLVLDEGAGDSIRYNDIVNIYLSIKLTDGTLIRSNIDTVHINHDSYDSTATYSHLVITHTQSGWGLAPPENDFLGLKGFIGMTEGITAALSKLKTGGRAMVITPSITSLQSTLSGSVNYSPGEVMVFDIYPTYVR